MEIQIRDIGNSKGVIIPAKFLKEAGIKKLADIELKDKQIILKASKEPRKNWLENIQKDPPSKNDDSLNDVFDEELMEDWQW